MWQPPAGLGCRAVGSASCWLSEVPVWASQNFHPLGSLSPGDQVWFLRPEPLPPIVPYLMWGRGCQGFRTGTICVLSSLRDPHLAELDLLLEEDPVLDWRVQGVHGRAGGLGSALGPRGATIHFPFLATSPPSVQSGSCRVGGRGARHQCRH